MSGVRHCRHRLGHAGENGIEVPAEARESGIKRIVMVTGFGSIETAIDAMKLGASDYLTKPVNLEELR